MIVSSNTISSNVVKNAKEGALAGAQHVYKACLPMGDHTIQVRVYAKSDILNRNARHDLISIIIKTEAEWIEKVKNQCLNPALATLDFWADGTFVRKSAKVKHHNILVKMMRAFNYPRNEGGVCYGFAHMGMQAILSDDLETFDERLQLLLSTDRREIKNMPLIDIDFPAFFDGISIYQSLRDYQYLFDLKPDPELHQNAILSAARASSKKIEREGGLALIDNFSGVYTKQDLVTYFEGLKGAYKGSSPLALILESGNHTVTIGYKGNKWMFIDVNRMPTHYFSTEDDIADKVLGAFSKNGTTAFATSMYCTVANKEHVSLVRRAWQPLQAVTPARAQAADAYGVTWFFTAAREGHLDVIKSFMNIPGFDRNHRAIGGETALYIATVRKRVAIVRELLKDPTIDRNLACIDGVTPLMKAASSDNLEVLKELREDPLTEINKARPCGTTALFTATLLDKPENVRELLKHPDIDPNKPQGELTPLFIAARNGHLEVASELLKHPKTNAEQPSNGVTPLAIAKASRHQEMADVLIAHLKLQETEQGLQHANLSGSNKE